MTNPLAQEKLKPVMLKQDLSQAKYLVSFISLMSPETKGYDKAASQMMNAVIPVIPQNTCSSVQLKCLSKAQYEGNG